MRREAKSEVRFVGTARGLESKLVPKAGFELSIIDSAGLKNVGAIARLRGLMLIPKSLLAARGVIRNFRPDIVYWGPGMYQGRWSWLRRSGMCRRW